MRAHDYFRPNKDISLVSAIYLSIVDDRPEHDGFDHLRLGIGDRFRDLHLITIEGVT
jgi:hypothetical protein